MALNILHKRRIYDDYLQDAPSNKGFEQWCFVTGEKYGVKPSVVRNVILQYRELEDLTLRQALVTESQRIAAMAGATRAEAFKALARGLHASNRRVITNKDGTIVDVLKTPDYGTQVRAAVEVLKSQGAYEPEKLTVEIEGDPTKLSNEQLLAEIRELAKQVAPAAAGAESAESGAGLPVLDEALHQDEGRAGSDPAVQAVP